MCIPMCVSGGHIRAVNSMWLYIELIAIIEALGKRESVIFINRHGYNQPINMEDVVPQNNRFLSICQKHICCIRLYWHIMISNAMHFKVLQKILLLDQYVWILIQSPFLALESSSYALIQLLRSFYCTLSFSFSLPSLLKYVPKQAQ